MAPPFRLDRGELKPARRMPDGRLIAEGLLTRAGVFSYRNPDGSERRELRPPEEVFRADALQSFAMVPLTNDHPTDLLDTKTARRHAVGGVGENVRKDEDFVRAPITVWDADTIAQMEAGKLALSCGYQVDLDETPGVHPLYGRYDAVQRNIRGNHVALVQAGRAGEAARVRMDAAAMIAEPRADAELSAEARGNLKPSSFAVPGSGQLPIHDAPHVRAAMARFGQTHFPDAGAKKTAFHRIIARAKELGVDTQGFETAHGNRLDGGAFMPEPNVMQEQVLAQLAIQTKRADDAEQQLASEKARADRAAAEVETLKKRLDAVVDPGDVEKLRQTIVGLTQKVADAEKARMDAEAPERIRGAVARRVKIETAARAILGAQAKLDDFSDRALQCAVIERTPVVGGKVDEKASDAWVESRFDSCVALYEAGERGKQTLRDAAAAPRQDERPADLRSSREKFLARQRELGTMPLRKES